MGFVRVDTFVLTQRQTEGSHYRHIPTPTSSLVQLSSKMTRKEVKKQTPVVYMEHKTSSFRLREEPIGRIHSYDLATVQNVRPVHCRARKIKVNTTPIRMNVSGCRANRGEPTAMMKVEFKESDIYPSSEDHNEGRKLSVKGVHYVGKEVTLTGFHSPILLSPKGRKEEEFFR